MRNTAAGIRHVACGVPALLDPHFSILDSCTPHSSQAIFRYFIGV